MQQRMPMAPAPAVGFRHLVLVGVNFAPRRATGDKNFWAELVPMLAAGVDRISIVSVRAEPSPVERLQIGACEIEIRYVPPALPSSSGTMPVGLGWLTWRGGSHPRIQGLISKQLVIRRLIAQITDLVRDRPSSQVHLMDNFGPANYLLARAARRHGARTSVTAIAYERRGRRLYDSFLRASYRAPGLRVVAYSRGLERRLRALGVRRDAVTRIPWGVLPVTPPTPDDRRAARERLGLAPEGPLVLWAGFIQQVREPDFRLALRLARAARARHVAATFMFAFKPETFRAEYASMHQPEAGIHVAPTSVDAFADALRAADLLLSPIEDRDCIVAPPLTWIESMAAGHPVLTTDVEGADELIDDGRTGYRARDEGDLVSKLSSILEGFESMGDACRAKVTADYNLASIQRAYLALWFGKAP